MIEARTFQVLACEVSIATTCRDIAGQLDYVAVKATQLYPVARHVAYRVDRLDTEYVIRENDEIWFRDGSADRVLIELFRRLYAVVYAEMSQSLRLHAGCGAHQGRLFLAAGPKGAGKSTYLRLLLLHLLRLVLSLNPMLLLL